VGPITGKADSAVGTRALAAVPRAANASLPLVKAANRITVLGREQEQEHIAQFLDEIPRGPAILLIEGEAGIGKTTLWESGVEDALDRGHRVLVTRAGEAETKLAYTALGDLLEPAGDAVIAELPDPQRKALEAALLLADTPLPAPDQRAISLATLAALRAFAEAGPTLLALDDLQWLDMPSARVMGFVVRRLRHERVGVLASIRLGEREGDPLGLRTALPLHPVRRIPVGPMPAGAMGHLIRARVGAALAHPVIRKVHQAAGGNPFFALEVARELARRGVPGAGEAFPIPDDLRVLLEERLEALPVATRAALLTAAAATRPTEPLVQAASGLGRRAAAELTRAAKGGIVELEGDAIRFTHPLLASTLYGMARVAERRAVHRRLAEHVDDNEERARHLALGTAGPDATVASELDEAARLASTRGAPQSAAELSELAGRLTLPADGDAICQRKVQAAEHHFDAGDAGRAWALLEEAIQLAEPGQARARILFRSASVSWMDMHRVQGLCERALAEAGENAELLTSIREHLTWVGIYRGDLALASAQAGASMESARHVTDRAITSEAMSTFAMVQFLLGKPAQDLMNEAERLADLESQEKPATEFSAYTEPRVCHGLQLLWSGELNAARATLTWGLNEYEKRGRYVVRDEILCYLAEVEARAGNWDVAACHANEAYEIDVESGRLSGQGHMLFPVALVAALRGDIKAARPAAERGLRQCLSNGDLLDASCHRWVLGFLELSLSDPSAAMEHFEPAIEYLRALGAAEPGIIPCVPDAIEALVALGDLGYSKVLLEEHELKARIQDRPWALATAARCRGLIAAAGGDLPEAIRALDQALGHHEGSFQPFDLGRTMLVVGEVNRRGKRKRAARLAFHRALELFEEVGAPLWIRKAEAGLSRTGGRSAEPASLSPTERRIADLVAEGRTNREVADALFVSVKTVEANLSRVYHKLGVRSRMELTRRMAHPGNHP
jgi:DNA-binding CsgD family transcriptional regulator/acid stress-induced BolA-like protein IbaG/YrbA